MTGRKVDSMPQGAVYATAISQLRRQYLMTCPGANVATNAAILSVNIAEWGTVPQVAACTP